MAKIKRIGNPLILTLMVVVSATVVGLVAVARPWQQRLLAQHLSDKIDQADDDQVDAVIYQVVALGEAGIPILIDAVGSYRASVAQAAQQALLRELDRIEQLPIGPRSTGLALLSERLATAVDAYGPSSRGLAADIAERILRIPTDAYQIDRGKLIEHCRKILFTTAAQRAHRGSGVLATRFASASQRRDTPADRAGERLQNEISRDILENSALPGGNLPQDVLKVRRLPPEKWRRPQQTDEPEAPNQLPLMPLPDARPGSPQPQRFTPPYRSKPLPSSSANGSEPFTRSSPDVGHMEIVQVIALLRDDRQDVVERATLELENRGMNDRHLVLARAMSSDRTEDRLRLAQQLPAIRDLDPAPWLLWLSHDEEPDVRLAALSAMATMGDAQVLKQVEQIAREDHDPRIVRLADRLATQRQAQRRLR